MKLDFIPFGPIAFPPDLEWLLVHPQYYMLAGGIMLALVAAWLLFKPRKGGFVARLGGLTWRRNQFCRGWLITGDTGSGKTSSGINQLAHQVFQNEPNWGGLCIDEKGVYWETLAAMARHYGREHDLIHLQIRADDTDVHWTPPHRYNLTGDRSIPFTTYAKFIVDSRDTSVHPTQHEAIERAREIALNQRSEVVIHGEDGKIRDKNSYGNDPFPPRG